MVQQDTQQKILDLNKWENIVEEQAQQYQAAHPFPYGQFEDFLEDWAADKAMDSFPAVKDSGWIHYVHFNEKKHTA